MIYLLSFVETPRKFIIAELSTKLNKYIVFTMQTYKKLKNHDVVPCDILCTVPLL